MSVEANKELVRGYVNAILVNRDFSKFNDFTARVSTSTVRRSRGNQRGKCPP